VSGGKLLIFSNHWLSLQNILKLTSRNN